jgi:hypothetical protein
LGTDKGKNKRGGKGPGKGFTKGAYGKSGSKGSEMSGYDGYKGKGKGVDSGKDGSGTRPFDCYCNHCWKYGLRKSECKLLDTEMARKGGGKGGKGKGAYDLQEEDDAKGNGEDLQEDPEEKWWVGSACALHRDDGFSRVDPRRSLRPCPARDLQHSPMMMHSRFEAWCGTTTRTRTTRSTRRTSRRPNKLTVHHV